MQLTGWTTLVVLAVYLWTGVNAARARVKYKVPAPAMDGPLGFRSAMRVQANTLEQLPLVLAPLYTCAYFLGDAWAAAGGLLWCLARVLYARGYYRDPAKREAGFVLGMIASGLLILGTVVGLLLH
ncbi:MAPEG family protein [Massilia horti]|uniref:MAPEG family protein n=1 Tax=Massilia horti TaxID=2562153 RepID=A0A4Y9T0H6_9BURK|nr:MAPEG family protein [Massilia horti]TFW32702.1 MAPEG family protein [Massilia horti]